MSTITMTPSIPQLMQGAESFYYRGGNIGCLCIHGFTASPAEVHWLGQHLHTQGHTVYGPRLPGHGIHHTALAHQQWQDWYSTVLDGYALLSTQCEQVVVLGLSMGGLLALLLASQQPVAGAVVMAAPLLFKGRSIQYARYLRWLVPYTDQTDRSSFADMIRQEQARRGEAVIGRVRYGIWSTQAVGQLYALSQVVNVHLPDIQVPLLLLYSEADQVVPLSSLEHITQQVPSQQVEVQRLTRSDHILPQDSERETVFALSSDFIHRHCNPASGSRV
jgi:carboxylesterase